MNWDNLKEMHCPRCNSKISDNGSMGYSCNSDPCMFFIGYERFRDIVNGLHNPSNRSPKTYTPLYSNEADSQAALNNL